MDEPRQRFCCPSCKKNVGLWEAIMVDGWRSIDETLRPTGQREVEWYDVQSEGMGGCSECNWEGALSQLEAIGLDGEPLPEIHPDQMTLG